MTTCSSSPSPPSARGCTVPPIPDYIAVKKFDDQGKVIGERRFLGLYTSRVYNERPDEIPLLRRKVDEVLKRFRLHCAKTIPARSWSRS